MLSFPQYNLNLCESPKICSFSWNFTIEKNGHGSGKDPKGTTVCERIPLFSTHPSVYCTAIVSFDSGDSDEMHSSLRISFSRCISSTFPDESDAIRRESPWRNESGLQAQMIVSSSIQQILLKGPRVIYAERIEDFAGLTSGDVGVTGIISAPFDDCANLLLMIFVIVKSNCNAIFNFFFKKSKHVVSCSKEQLLRLLVRGKIVKLHFPTLS